MEKLNPFKKKINKLYYFLFKEYFSKKINFKFDNVYRWDLIEHLDNKYKFSLFRSLHDTICSLGMMSTWVGACGLISRNAKIYLVSPTILDGISPFIIWQNIQLFDIVNYPDYLQ